MAARPVLIGMALFGGQIASVYFWGFPWWVPLTNIVFAGGMYAVRLKPEVALITTAAHFGLCLSSLAWMPALFWIPLAATTVAVWFIVGRFRRV